MHPTVHQRRRVVATPIAAVAAALATVVALAAPVTAASPASAHSQLLESDPVEGAALESPPEQVTLTFNEDILELGAMVYVVDAAGVDHAGEAVVDGPTVTVPLETTLPGGASEVRWRVVSADGHPISDVIPFTVDGETPVATEEADASAEPQAPVVEAEPSAEPDAAAATDEGGAPRTLLVGIAGAAAALVVLALVLGMRRRRATATTTDTD